MRRSSRVTGTSSRPSSPCPSPPAEPVSTRSYARGGGQALLARLVPATGLTDTVVALFDQDHLEPLATYGRSASDLSREEWQLANRAIVTGRVLTGGPTEDAGTVIAAPL